MFVRSCVSGRLWWVYIGYHVVMVIRLRVWFLYALYVLVGIALMVVFRQDVLPSVVERVMATIMLYTFIWAASVTQAVYVGNRTRRANAKMGDCK